MDTALETPRTAQHQPPDPDKAWEIVLSQLQFEMPRGNYGTWVVPLRPLSFKEGVFRLAAANANGRDWVEQRLGNRIVKLLEAVYLHPVRLSVKIQSEDDTQSVAALYQTSAVETAAPVKTRSARVNAQKANPQELEPPLDGGSPRKIQLQRAYGTERARIVQPERGMFITMYFFSQWLPRIGHSAMAVILAARALCYWNVKTGEMRNVIETDMSEIAKRASVSVRTVKDVLNNPLIKDYFLRYKVRRVMTTNGVRTAGILLFVRMDDPLTPEDQDANQLIEEERWYTVDFEEEEG